LRADLHITFDKPHLAFVPKPVTDGSSPLVAHLLEYNRELRPRCRHAVRTLRIGLLHAARGIVLFGSDARISAYDTFLSTLDFHSLPTLLVEKWLEPERRRLDPRGIWNKDHDWA
jgi:hypothetical protein